MIGRICQQSVDSLDSGQTVWDDQLTGFGCRTAKGGVKSYVVKYRYNGRQRWVTIGRHGSPWTPKAARSRAQSILRRLARGEDPSA